MFGKLNLYDPNKVFGESRNSFKQDFVEVKKRLDKLFVELAEKNESYAKKTAEITDNILDAKDYLRSGCTLYLIG